MKPRAQREAELSILAKRTEAGTAQIERRIEELAKMRSDREACPRDGEDAPGTLRRSSGRKSSRAAGTRWSWNSSGTKLARAEKVFEVIAQRAVQLQTERGRRPGSR